MSSDSQFGRHDDAKDLARRGSVLTIDELRRVFEGTVCPACQGAKRSRSAFCATDTSALTIWQRRSLAGGIDDPQFQQAFRSTLRHLELNATRVRKFAPVRGGWSYQTESELRAAGYRWHSFFRCGVPGCGQPIHLYTKPDKSGRVAVNAEGYQPHATTCTDPEYFQRQREAKQERRKAAKAAQTSARRRPR
ncbi:hypothetical protein Acid345_3182 [Candidatus Koribacter versatilis Ellin345]|uniref:Uncharacterized protein n=1 Tax=Koribacter versatilis (strain Ellin345) TaxID=204669 RepID=Q1ILR7_KORVE|nr:hypothetical protein [Candidatus Koribacter versatilis]ABF42183.1 hypothetical protein Acid345_3182 [Candidatus Koribacter versatilis Ellin345]